MHRRRQARRRRSGGLPAQRDGRGGCGPRRRGPIGLVPAGERRPDDTLRVAAEDALGVGAIAAALQQGHPAAVRDGFALSPEAQLAAAQFVAASRNGLLGVLTGLASGRELIADGYSEDVRLASDLDVSEAVPRLVGGVLCG